MGRRRISQDEVKDIGKNRIHRLTDMAREETHNGNVDRARRYVEIARKISAKSKSPMPKENPYCKNCLTPLVPGVNCRVRLSNHTIHTTCCLCGEIARRPYIREQSNEREGRQEGTDEES